MRDVYNAYNTNKLYIFIVSFATVLFFFSLPRLWLHWLSFFLFGFFVENQNSVSSLFFDSFRIPFWPFLRSVHPFAWPRLWNAVFAACFEHFDSFRCRHRQMIHFLIHAMMSNESFTCGIIHCFVSCASQQRQH